MKYIIFLSVVLLASCTSIRSTFNSPEIIVKTIHIKAFKSHDPLIAEQVKKIVEGCYIDKTQLEIVYTATVFPL